MKRIIAACVAAIAVSASGETFETRDGFSVVLPDGWVEIPGTVLQAYAEKVNQLSSDTPQQAYDCGYQIDHDGVWMTYPYILVQFRPIGRIPWGELARFPEKNLQTEDGPSEVSVVESAYDKKNHILWSKLTAPTEDGETAKALVAVKLTELGYIRLTGCATEDSFDQYAKVFRDAFIALEIDESIAYKPRFGDTMPVVGGIMTGRVLKWVIQAVMIGGALWLVYILLKRLARKRKT